MTQPGSDDPHSLDYATPQPSARAGRRARQSMFCIAAVFFIWFAPLVIYARTGSEKLWFGSYFACTGVAVTAEWILFGSLTRRRIPERTGVASIRCETVLSRAPGAVPKIPTMERLIWNITSAISSAICLLLIAVHLWAQWRFHQIIAPFLAAYGDHVHIHDSYSRIQIGPASIPPSLAIALTAILPAVWLTLRLRLRLRRASRKRAGRCLICGYDLRASTGRCPECGNPISW